MATLLLLVFALTAGCSAKQEGEGDDASAGLTAPAVEPPGEVFESWQGDLSGMAARRVIRALVVYNRAFYTFDQGTQRGISYERLKAFEDKINEELGTGLLQVQVVCIPVTREQLLPALREGRGDLVAANLTVTPERSRLVDFSTPLQTDVRELVVSGPKAPPLHSLEDLAGKKVYVRASNSYYESLQLLNAQFEEAGKPAIKIQTVDDHLEAEDLLEMVNAGLIPITVVDSHLAAFWAQIFDRITVHEDLAVNTGGQIAWAFRKDSPELRAAVNAFVAEHKKGTLFGNIMHKRYLENADYVRNATSEAELEKFREMVHHFRAYGEQYAFDWLLLAAQAYQESRLDQSKRSSTGAVGVMQIKPSTAADPNVGIAHIERLENNIHAGTKYLRFIADRYFEDASMERVDKALFALASYNAGPARVAALRKEAARVGLDPDRWFDNVEVVAAREIGRETVQYVSNISKYYVAYRQIMAQQRQRAAAT